MPKQVLHITNDLSELARLSAWVEQFVAAASLPEGMAFQINLCLDELITNTVLYGYTDQHAHTISVELDLAGTQLAVRLIDDGRAFNPFADAPEPDLESELEDRPIGGLGVFLVQELMDAVDYHREGSHNRIDLTKNIPESP